jgi:DNA invertase Pin-like site-specific DNA recombinase
MPKEMRWSDHRRSAGRATTPPVEEGSLGQLIVMIDGIGKAGAGFQSLSESIDTTTAGGRLIFHVMGALAEFERSLIGERTRAGMQAAKRRGKAVGRPRKLSPHQLARARALIEAGEETRAGVAELFGVDVATLRRALKKIPYC